MNDTTGTTLADLKRLIATVAGVDRVLILPHNDPDPDAIASAFALRHLLAARAGVEGLIRYRGIIGRAENKALVRYLNNPLRQLPVRDLNSHSIIALVDTQPGAGNNALPPNLTPAIVFDHHPWREASANVTFSEVRPSLGSTSTILTEYLQVAELEPSSQLATALFYGIKADTQGLLRFTSPADSAAYNYLQPLVDTKALLEIERAQVSREYFEHLDATLHAARIYGTVVVSYVGAMGRPDLAAEMADLLLRLKDMQWSLCMGVYEGELILAVRTRSPVGGAGQLVQSIVGSRGSAGGHGFMAGGQVPLRGADPANLAHELALLTLQYLGISPAPASVSLLS